MASFVSELRRRDVFRVGAAYAVAAWLLLQVADVVLPTFQAPIWVMQGVTVVLIIGFPLALIFAWLFDITPDGVRLDAGEERPELATRIKRRKIDFAIFGLMAVAIVVLVVDRVLTNELPAPIGAAGSIAVLPFENRSAVAEDAYFVDGIHDDILTQLSKLSAFEKVISRTSVEKYRGTTKSMAEIGQELGVTTILEGGVQRAGDRVRINVQLIEAETDTHQWAETYERQMTAENVFVLQAEIASAVANELQATLSSHERENLSRIPTTNIAALENYFRGNVELARRTTSSLRAAGSYFQTAIDLDPDFALAYIGLANVYNLRPYYAGTKWQDDIEQAESLIDKALRLNGSSAEAYEALGFSKSWTNNAEAEANFRKAIEFSPNNGTANSGLCDLLNVNLGRPADALQYCEKAYELDPLSPIIGSNLGWVQTGLGRYDDASIQFRQVLDTNPDFSNAYSDLAYLYSFALARGDEAIRYMRKAIELDPESPVSLAWLGHMYTDVGDVETARYWFEQAIRIGPDNSDAVYGLAILNWMAGSHSIAAEYARKAVDLAPNLGFALALIRDQSVSDGRWDDAREIYADRYPELINGQRPDITSRNFQPAVDLSMVLMQTRETERTNLLHRLVSQYIQTVPRTSPVNGFGIADVQIYAIRGEVPKALSTLRSAVDEGWRSGWAYFLKHDLNVQSIRDEPEFQAIVAELEADMTEHLERVRSWEAAGELAPIPDLLIQ